MDMYEDDGAEGVLNIARARDELKSSATVRDAGTRRAIVAEISAAALLDIAASLRPLALESRIALREDFEDVTGEDEPVTDENRDFFVVGDLVHLANDTEPGEITNLLFTEGELAADVSFASGYSQRHYASDLVRIIETREAAAAAEITVGAMAEELERGNAEALDDDDEFTPPPTALDALDEKPAKKKKGGK